MSKGLQIADGLSLPLDAVTQTIGILAKRRAGKSYCARRIVEQLFQAGLQVVIVDPKGDWHGIRSSADGKAAGLPVIILGGEHGDIPLEVGSGEMVAKLVVEERVSILLDLSLLRKHEVATFMTAFLENLYRLKAKEIYRTPMMLCIDEADAIAPQKPQKGEERMLGAAEDIVRRGGQRGIGCMLVTQRSAVLNKNVLTQVGMLVALRTIAPQDLEAMKAWIDVHGTLEQQKTLMGSLPSLPVGDAWFWSPGWPTESGIFKRVHVHRIETFDSGATPKPGEKRIEPKKAADIDLEALRRSMAETVKRAEANDPKKLRQRIADLERQVATGGKGKPVVVDNREQLAALTAERDHWKKIADSAMRLYLTLIKRFKSLQAATIPKLEALRGSFDSVVSELEAETNRLDELTNAVPAPAPTVMRTTKIPPVMAPLRQGPAGDLPDGLSAPHKKILDALARLEAVGVTAPRMQVVSSLAGYSFGGGAWNNYTSKLNVLGLIVKSSGTMALTDAGRALATFPDSPVILEDLHQGWLSLYAAPVRKLLVEIIAAYPKAISKETLADRTGYTIGGGAWNNYLSRLRATGAVESTPDGIRATELLFPEGLM